MIEHEDIIDTSTNTNSNNTSNNNDAHNEETQQPNPENDEQQDTNPTKEEPFCHFIFLPGQNVNVGTYTCFKCMKMKEKGNILSSLGLKSSKYYEVNYLIFINESFLYYVMDTSTTTANNNIMRIESKSNLNDLINFYLNKVDDSSIYRFDLEFAGESKNEEVSLFFQEKEINDFLILFQNYLVKLGILHIQQEQGMENEEGENEYNEYIQSGNIADKETETVSNSNSSDNSNTMQMKEDDKYSGSIEDNDNQCDFGDDEGNGSTSMKKPKHKKKKKKQGKKQMQTEPSNESNQKEQ